MFKYRLERVLSLREEELEKVKLKFQEAAQKVREAEHKIELNKQAQLITLRERTTPLGLSSPSLYVNRLQHLKNQLLSLEEDLHKAKEDFEIVKQELIEAQQKTEALKKHKSKQKSEYDKAELKKEENQLNELALIMRRLKEDQDAEG